VFENFPKTRPPLPPEIAEIYTSQYKSNREGQTTASSLSQRMEAWLHYRIARDVTGGRSSAKSTLELGAGTLNQLPYEPESPIYDIVEPFTALYEGSPLIGRIRNIYPDIAEVPNSFRYDRITSVATLEHLCHLPEIIARCGLLLTEDGVFRASIPNEGTLLWTLGWKLTTGLEFRIRHRLDYGLLMRHEHVNTAQEIEEVLRYFFRELNCEVCGISKAIAFYRFYECRGPHVDRCRQYLGQDAGEDISRI